MLFKKRISILSSIVIIGSLIGGCNMDKESKSINSEELMANTNARKAILMAIDKEDFVDVILNDGSTVADYFVPRRLATDENQNDYRDYAGNLAYDSNDEKAKEEWKKAKDELGFETVNLDIVLSDNEVNKKLGEYVQEELSILDGINVKIKQVPFKQLLDSQDKGEFDISFGGWGPDYPDPLTYLATFANNSSYGESVGYNSKEYEELLEKGKNSKTTDESWKYYKEAEKLLLEDAYLSPVYQRGVSYLQKNYVSGIVVSNFGPKYSYKWADVDKDDKTLNISSTADITILDGAKIKDALTREITLNVMEGLVRLDKDLNVVGGVAKDWNTSEDGKTWTFNIRDDAKWSNGEKITAHDFEYSFKRTLTPETGCENSSVFYDIVGAEDYNLSKNKDMNSVGVKAIDDSTLEINLIRPVPYFDKLLSHPIFAPQNQAFVEEKGELFGTSIENTLFNGPYILSGWKMEDQYNMKKNDNYWDKESVKLETINTKVVKDSNAALNLYQAGEIDRTNLAAEQVDKYKDSEEFGTELDCVTYFLLLNAENREK